jgi:hypothetical protein
VKSIWKYPLNLVSEQSVDMPQGAQMLTVQMQHEQPHIWALVDPASPKVGRFVMIYGTGHGIPDDTGRYVGTFQLADGDLVFHVFESIS